MHPCIYIHIQIMLTRLPQVRRLELLWVLSFNLQLISPIHRNPIPISDERIHRQLLYRRSGSLLVCLIAEYRSLIIIGPATNWLNLLPGSLIFHLMYGIHSRLALGICSLWGDGSWNSLRDLTTSPTLGPFIVFRTYLNRMVSCSSIDWLLLKES